MDPGLFQGSSIKTFIDLSNLIDFSLILSAVMGTSLAFAFFSTTSLPTPY